MSQENRITVLVNGPLLCTGDIEVVAEDGYVFGKSDELALCRCGESKNRPFCDGSHKEAGFENDGIIVSAVSEELKEAEGPLKITVRSNAMLLAEGPMAILCADGSCTAKRNKAALCRCGQSGNKPFCDGSHKESGFEG